MVRVMFSFAVSMAIGIVFIIWGDTGIFWKLFVALFVGLIALFTFGVIPMHFIVPRLMMSVLVIALVIYFKASGLWLGR